MIKIKRTSIPKVLKDSPSNGKHYKKKEVVKALWEMQHGKCCYCERNITEEGYEKAVDHFRPKSIFPYLTNHWENLLLACPQCNGNKSNKFAVLNYDNPDAPMIEELNTPSGNIPAIIDPSNQKIDPEDHIGFDFIGTIADKDFGIMKAKDESMLGKVTIDTIKIDSDFFIRKRRSHFLKNIFLDFRNLLVAKEENNEARLTSCKNAFLNHMSATGEFAAFVRAFARHEKLDQPPIGLKIPTGSEM